MAGESGADAIGPPAPVSGGSSFPNAKPSAGPSLTPATTAPNSSIVLTPGATSDANAASLAFRSAPILLRRARTEAATSPCVGATSAPNCGDDGGAEATGLKSPPPPAAVSGGDSVGPTATAFVSLIDLTLGSTSADTSFAFRSA